MDVLALLDKAREAGVEVVVDGDGVRVSGPESQEPLVKRLMKSKPDLLAHFNGNGETLGEKVPEALDDDDAQPSEKVPYPEKPQEKRDTVTFTRITSAELAGGDYAVEYLVDGIMVAGQPMIVAGPQKSLKTSVLIDLAVALDTCGEFLGHFPATRAVRVCVMSGESGLATLQETAARVCEARGVALSDLGIIWSPDLPRFDNGEHLYALADFLQDDEIEVLIMDPAYLAMPSADAGNLMAQGELLRNITKTLGRIGVQLVLAHHTKKNRVGERFDPLSLEDIAWAGFQEFARQWLLINRREEYEAGTGEHRMWLSVGGSAGHSGLYGLDVSEGVYSPTTPRTWDVSVSGATNTIKDSRRRAEQRKAAEQERRAGENKRKLADAMKCCPGGETATRLRELSGLNGTAYGEALRLLTKEGRAIECDVVKANGQQYQGWKYHEPYQPDTQTHPDKHPDNPGDHHHPDSPM